MRFESIKEWKKTKLLNESVVESSNNLYSKLSEDIKKSIDSIVSYAISEDLPKKQTIKYIESVYTNPSKAPESISVHIVRENLDIIIEKLNNIYHWPSESIYLKLIENIKNEDDTVFIINGVLNVYNKNKLYDDKHLKFLKESKAVLVYKDIKWVKEILK